MKCLFKSFLYFWIEWFVFLLLIFEYFIYSGFVLCSICVCKYFLLVLSLSFPSLSSVIHRAKAFTLDEIQFIMFFFYASRFGIMSKISLPNPRTWRFSPVFFETLHNFIFIYIYKPFLIHFSKDVQFRLRFSLKQISSFSYTIFFVKTIMSLILNFSTLSKNQLAIFPWFYFWTLFCSIDPCSYPFANAVLNILAL